MLIALDRQERGQDGAASAVQEVRRQFGIPVIAIVDLSDLMHHTAQHGRPEDLAAMQAYRTRYGAILPAN